jgi:hypothetical protein
VRQEVIGNFYQDGQKFGQVTLGSNAIEYFQGGGLRVSSPAGSIPLNTYVHVALTYDGSVNRLYLNGNLAATSEVHVGETFDNPVRLGFPIINAGNARLLGLLDEVEIFSRALSQTEVRGIFDSGSVGKCKEGLLITGAVSRKMHGALGPFDIPLPITGAPGVECRTSGGNHTLVFTFTNDVVSGNASVTSGVGSVSGSPIFTGNTMTVNLSGVADVQQIAVTLSDVTDSFARVLPNTVVSMNLLMGDSNGNKTVNATDIGQVKGQSGAPVTAANFRRDLTPNGSINATDVGLVKSRSGASVP